MIFHKTAASFFGIGYLGKGSGTIAAAIATLLLFLLLSRIPEVPLLLPLLSILIILAGVWSSGKMVPYWGKDPQRVVIDEVAGIMVTFICIPVSIPMFVAGFVLFRLFDIFKPLGINKMEKWPYGWGIMADDILAGVYANLILQIVLAIKLF